MDMRSLLLSMLAALASAQLNNPSCASTNVLTLALETAFDCANTNVITAHSSTDATSLDCLGRTAGELEVIFLFEPFVTGLYRISTCDSSVSDTTAHVWSLLEVTAGVFFFDNEVIFCDSCADGVLTGPYLPAQVCPGINLGTDFIVSLEAFTKYAIGVEKGERDIGDGIYSVALTCDASVSPTNRPATPSPTATGEPTKPAAGCNDPVAERGVFPMSCAAVTSQQISSTEAMLDCNDEAPYGFQGGAEYNYFEDYSFSEVYIPFSVPHDGLYRFETCGSTIGTRVHLFELAADGQLGAQLVKCDNDCNLLDAPTAINIGCPDIESPNESFDISLSASQDLVLLVENEAADGFAQPGTFQVDITCPEAPSDKPSSVPSEKPSSVPSEKPSSVPSEKPSGIPSLEPSREPSRLPVSDAPTPDFSCYSSVQDLGAIPLGCDAVGQAFSQNAYVDCNEEYGFVQYLYDFLNSGGEGPYYPEGYGDGYFPGYLDGGGEGQTLPPPDSLGYLDGDVPEIIFTFVPPTTGLYVFDLCSSEVADTHLHIWHLFPNGTLEKPLANCQNDCSSYIGFSDANSPTSLGCPDMYKERLQLLLTGGEEIAVLVENSYYSGGDGLINLDVECPSVSCSDNVSSIATPLPCDSTLLLPSVTSVLDCTGPGTNTSNGQPEMLFLIEPPGNGTYRIETCGSSIDTVVSLWETSAQQGAQVLDHEIFTCNDGLCHGGVGSECPMNEDFVVQLVGGQTYVLGVEGVNPSNNGSFEVSLLCPGVSSGFPTLEPSSFINETLLPDDVFLLPQNVSSSYRIGESVAMGRMIDPLGFVIALGAPGALGGRGIVFLYALESYQWVEKGTLEPKNGELGMQFGASVAIGESSDVIAVGAFNASASFGPGDGAAFIFRWNGTTFVQDAELIPAIPIENASFGFSVDISKYGSHVAIGAPSATDGNGSAVGAAYIADRLDDWDVVKIETPAEAIVSKASFGWSISVNAEMPGVFVAAAAPGLNAVYVLSRNFTTANASAFDLNSTYTSPVSGAVGFGFSMEILREVVVIGAPFAPGGGAAFIYEGYDRPTQELLFSLEPESTASPNSLFGYSVAIGEDVAIIGAPGDDRMGSGAGAVYFFSPGPQLPNGTLTTVILTEILAPSELMPGDDFGKSVAAVEVLGLHVTIGVPGRDTMHGNDTGGAVLVLSPDGPPSVAPTSSSSPTQEPTSSISPTTEPTSISTSPTFEMSLPVIRPELLTAVMTDSGAAVTLGFSVNVDLATPVPQEFFNCTELFDDQDIVTELCTWTSSLTMRMIMTSDSTLLPGTSALTLKSGAINASCAGIPPVVPCGPNEQGSPVLIAAPPNPVQPKILLNYDPTGTACKQTYLVDASASLNSGGRPWEAVVWELLPLADADQALLDAAIESSVYFESVLASGNVTLEFNTTLLLPEIQYRLNVTLENFLGAKSSESPIEFVISDTSTTVAQLSGSSNELAVPDKVLSVSTTVIQPCDGSEETNSTALNFTGWFAEDSEGSQIVIEVESSSEQELVIAPYTFEPGEFYTLYWTGSVDDAGGGQSTLTISKSIEVIELPLNPSVLGCDQTIVPVKADGSSVFHIIDAKASSDPNIGPLDSAVAKDGVQINFTSKAYSNDGLTTFAAIEGFNETGSCNITAEAQLLPDMKTLQLNATALQGCDIVIDVEVQSVSRNSSAVEQCFARVLSTSSPDVSITTIVAGTKINPGETFRIQAEIASTSGVDAPIMANWTLEEGSFVNQQSLAEVATTPTLYSYSAASLILTGTLPANLGLAGGTLREGFTYTMVLAAQYGDIQGTVTVPAQARIEFVVNERPTSGTIDVSPKSGDYRTVFALVAASWVDDDLPLQYFFQARLSSLESDILDLNPSVSTNRLDVQLPPGRQDVGFVVDVSLIVRDSFGAEAFAQQAVIVEPGSAEDMTNSAYETLSGFDVTASDTDTGFQVINYVSSLASSAFEALGDGGDVALEDIRGLLIDVAGVLFEFIDDQFIDEDVLRSQASSLAFITAVDTGGAGGSTAYEANLTESVLSIASTIVSRSAEQSGDDETLLGEEPTINLLTALSDILGYTNSTEQGTAQNASSIVQQLQLLRARELLVGEDPEVIEAPNLIAITTREIIDEDADTFLVDNEEFSNDSSDQSLNTSFSIGKNVLQSLREQAGDGGDDESFVVGVIAVSGAAYNSSDTSGSSLVTGVQRLAISLAGDGTGLSLLSAGTITIVQGLSDDAQNIIDEQCASLVNPGNATCETLVECAYYDAASDSFIALDECVGTLIAEGLGYDRIECVCNFGELRRRLQDSSGNATESTVDLDFGSLMSSAYVNVGDNFENLDDPTSSSPIMWAVVAVVISTLLLFGYRADMLDKKDAHAEGGFFDMREARRDLEAWMHQHKFSQALQQKLTHGGILSMRDIGLLEELSAFEFDKICFRFEFTSEERSVMANALKAHREFDRQQSNPLLKSSTKDRPIFSSEALKAPSMTKATGLGSSPTSVSSEISADNFGRKLENSYDAFYEDLWFGLLIARPEALLAYEEPPLSKRVVAATKRHHDYYEAFSLSPGDRPTRFVRVLRIMCFLMSTMTTNTIVYQVLYPNDEDYCNQFDGTGNEEECEEDSSSLNNDQNRCYYEDSNCSPTQPVINAETLVIAATIALVFVVPLEAVVQYIVDTYLSQSPYASSNVVTNHELSRKALLRRLERKQATVIAEKELNFLMEHPEVLSRTTRQLLRLPLTRALALAWLRRRVYASAFEAAQIETELEPEHRALMTHVDAGQVAATDFLEIVRMRKIRVMKIAIRDSLPFLRKRVFKRYTHLLGEDEPTHKRVRLAAIGALICYILASCAYVVGYGVTTTDEVALAWLLSFIITEIFTALLLMPLRILVISVVLPNLVRQDVSIERAMFNLPHWSAAALFARLRTDLVPGLNLILDERFIKLVDRKAEKKQKAIADVAAEDPELGKSQSAQKDASGKRLSKRQQKKKDVASDISVGELVTVLKAGDERSLDLDKMNLVSASRSGAFASRSGVVSATSLSTTPGMASGHPMQTMDRSDTYHLTSVVEEEEEFDMNAISDENSGSHDPRKSIVALRIASGRGKDGNEGAPEEKQKEEGNMAGDDLHTKTAHELASELRRRSLPMKWATRSLLAVFALLVLLPEPFQDLFLEEGLPIGFGLFVLLDTGLPIEIEIVEVFVNAVLLLAFILLLLSLIFIVQRSIVNKVELLKKGGVLAKS